MLSMDRSVVGSFLMLSSVPSYGCSTERCYKHLCLKSLLPLHLSLSERVGALTTSSVCVVGQPVILQDGEVVVFPVD